MKADRANDESYPDARPIVDAMLRDAVARRASDVHVEPTAGGYEIRMRVDGLLETVARHETNVGRAIVARLMVMGNLLTYRLDVPQEGRIAAEVGGVDVRLAVMPTTHGVRAAVRLPAELIQPRTLEELDLPAGVMRGLREFAGGSAGQGGEGGMLLLIGPAGSGKTTTIYALLEHIAATSPGLSIVALEDPVERDVPGVTQIEVSPFGQLTYERALRSILRQDPQVLMLGEIRDAATATLAIQATLSGHRLISTFHAATPAGAIARLMEMGIEPYQITSSLTGIVSQRLLRRKTPTGYQGRVAVGEFAKLDNATRAAILQRADSNTLQPLFERQPDFVSIRQAIENLVKEDKTDTAEAMRVFGSVLTRSADAHS